MYNAKNIIDSHLIAENKTGENNISVRVILENGMYRNLMHLVLRVHICILYAYDIHNFPGSVKLEHHERFKRQR